LREQARVVRDEDESNQGLEDNPIESAFKLNMTDEHAISLHNLLPEA
jgi:hypothetical protein